MKIGQVFLSIGQAIGQVFLINLTNKKLVKIESYGKLVRLVRSFKHVERLGEENQVWGLFFVVRLVRSGQKQNLTSAYENLTNEAAAESSNFIWLASSIKRARRSRAEIDVIKTTLYSLLSREHPMTCRQVFYRLVSAGVIAKTEAEYDGTVIRLLTKMRRAKELPFHWLADNTRWMRKPRAFSSWEEALRSTAATYRRALWQEQAAYVEVWLEKDALAGVLYPVTEQWDVPLMVTRGYSSVSFLYSAARSPSLLKRNPLSSITWATMTPLASISAARLSKT